MSLDVYLEMDVIDVQVEISRIFIRENGQMIEITRQEWDKRYPGIEPISINSNEGRSVYSANITHNLGIMAAHANVYQALWRPEELGITTAEQLIEPLQNGLNELKKDPEIFKKFNPANGWGNYEGLVAFIEEYLQACKQFPKATVRTWR